MNLSVTHRIAAGYGVVLALALGIMITGLVAIANINARLLQVVDTTAPMLAQSGALQSSLLRAYALVEQGNQAQKLDDLSAIESEFAAQQQFNAAALARLIELAQSDSELSASLDESSRLLQQMFSLAPESLSSHRRELELATTVNKQKRKFGDMADEVESAASGLAREAKNLSTTISNIRMQAEHTLEKNIAAAVTTADKEIRENFTDVDRQLNQLSSAQKGAITSAYNRFKEAILADNGLLLSYRQQLEQRKNAQTKAAEMSDVVKQAIVVAQRINDVIESRNDASKDEAAATVKNSRILLMLFALLAVSIALFIGFRVVQSIRLPLQSVVSTIKNLATGDLRTSIELHRQDELGEVAESLRELIARLREMLAAIHENSERLAASAAQTSTIASKTLNNISKQKEQTDMVASAVTEMAATVDDVAKNANRTLMQVESTGSETKDGQRVFNENSESVRYLAREIDRATEVVSKVSDESGNIGAVLEVIRGVAEQTNLLALNAAIEAARAGEQGRGFAVVADEVRTLASRSQHSTVEIQEIINRLQSGTRDAVSAMSESKREAQTTVSKIDIARDTLQKITVSIDVIKDMSMQIASAADEQNAVTQELHRNIETIAEAAEQNANGARENQAASLELTRLAEQQKQLAGRFQLA